MEKFKKIFKIELMLLFVAFLLSTSLQSQTDEIKEEFRPKLHFTPEKNWVNDPNGMFYYDGEYHLFYQHNPYGTKWGHMSWGHAVSTDLIKWNHLTVALEEENGVMIFSGSVVVDRNNSSGFGTNLKPAIVAIYTSYDAATGFQHQSIAYSNDKGRTFTKYKGNPVLNINSKEFRDPKVFWYEPEQKWIMALALSTEHKIQFYSSKNLKDWSLMSEFGPKGVITGVWECPDLFTLSHKGKTKWVLMVSLGSGSIAGGSGIQYFIGEFDGKNFVADHSVSEKGNAVDYIDYGKDFYAAVTWNGAPDKKGTKTWLGWMNNWQYANEIPTNGWRGSMSLPRKLILDKEQGKYIIRQEAVKSVQNYIKSKTNLKGETLARVNQKIEETDLKELTFEMAYEFKPSEINGQLEFEILNNDKSLFQLTFNKNTNEFVVKRVDNKLKDEFQSTQKITLSNNADKCINVRLFLDKNSVEVFINDGRYVFTNTIFPKDFNTKIHFSSIDDSMSKMKAITISKY
ncbi:MAG TPA: glycoside hydrolase family 32 protein [Flavobacterium sp.]|nr:glycoside hydrolase family 32 protein [Flavobacterium sp.]